MIQKRHYLNKAKRAVQAVLEYSLSAFYLGFLKVNEFGNWIIPIKDFDGILKIFWLIVIYYVLTK